MVTSSSSNAAYDWTAGYNVARGYTVDGLNRYTSSGGLNLSYDPRGNLNNDGVTSFGYDVSNKLTALSNGATLAYDAADRLAQTTGASTTRFLYDGDQIIGEYDASANVLRRYAPGPGIDQPLVWYEGSGTADRRFLLADRQGSVVAVTSASGGLMAINSYDEAGIPGPNNTGRFQWNGAPFLPEAGLYHMRARAYSPTLGRFMQTDPIGYGDGMNAYNYAHSDPVNGWDPSGTQDAATNPPADSAVQEVAVIALRPCPKGTHDSGGRTNNPSGNTVRICSADLNFLDSLYISSLGGYAGGKIGYIPTGSGPSPNNTQHKYHIRVRNNCSASDSFLALEQPNMSAPGSPQAQEGTTRNIQLWGNGGHNLITQIVNSGSGTITNITQPGHQFYFGKVVFHVTPSGSGSVVDITGTGSGPDPLYNDLIGYAFFGLVAENLAISCGAPGN